MNHLLIWLFMSMNLVNCKEIQIYNQSFFEIKNNFTECVDDHILACEPGTCIPAPRNKIEAYSCDCGDDAYLNRTFDPITRAITVKCTELPPNPCRKCHHINTMICLQLNESKVHCQCYPEFSSSSMCNAKKNSCKELSIGSTVLGDLACRVNLGNLCLPEIGTDSYTCVCMWPYRSSNQQNFPNCLGAPERLCDNYLCVGFSPDKSSQNQKTYRQVTVATGVRDTMNVDVGNCTQSKKNAMCNCPSNWVGLHCTQKRGHALKSTSTPWSPCHPDCLEHVHGEGMFSYNSPSDIGYIFAKTACSVADERYCRGNYKIWRRCKVNTLCNRDKSRTKGTISDEVAVAASIALKNIYLEKDEFKSMGPRLSEEEKIYAVVIFFSTCVSVALMSIVIMEAVMLVQRSRERTKLAKFA